MSGAIYEFVTTHKAVLGVLGAWLYREAHLLYGGRQSLYAAAAGVWGFLSREGGMWGINRTIWTGKSPAKTNQETVNQKPS